MTVNTVVVGLELGQGDAVALRVASSVASWLGAEVLAVHALELGEAMGPDAPVAARAMQAKVDERVRSAERTLRERLQAEAAEGRPAKLRLEGGRPFEALLRVAEEVSAGAIVVGAGRTHGSMLERLLGSTADQLLRHTTRPVVVAPSDLPVAGRWLVAVDPSEPAARALELAQRWATAGGVALELVHATSDSDSEAVLRSWLHTVAPGQALAGRVTYIDELPQNAILGHAAHTAAGMIVLGTHARSGLARALLGSVAAAVVRGASIPVLCVP